MTRDPRPGETYTIHGDRWRITACDGETVEDECLAGVERGQTQSHPLDMWRRLMANAKRARGSNASR